MKQDARIRLNHLMAEVHRMRAAEHDLVATMLKAAKGFESLEAAILETLAPYAAERAAAMFEGRTPPSLEVFAAQSA